MVMRSIASTELLIVQDPSYLESIDYTPGKAIQTTKAGVSIFMFGWGNLIHVRRDTVKNICSKRLLKMFGFGVTLLHVCAQLEL